MINKTVHISDAKANRVARINSLLEGLRKKIQNFVVLDKHGQLVGSVRNLIIDDQRQLNFVVSKSNSLENRRFFLLNSMFVEKVDSQNRHIYIKLDKLRIQDLPEYTDRTQFNKMEQNSNALEAKTQNTAPITASDADKNVERDSVDEIIRLLGERLVVDRSKRKVGEVIVRKQIETRMVQVPVRHEKLIVEQVSPERKQLAEIDLRQEEISAVDFPEGKMPEVHSFDGSLTVSGEFTSPKIASLLLNAIALERNHGCKAVRVTIVVEDEEQQKTYQEWFARTSKS